MLHALKHYLLHVFKSMHLHGIHSPFVFHLQHRCFYGKTPTTIYAQLQRYRDDLKTSPAVLSIQDYGAGSKKLSSTTRSVQDILRVNATPLSRAALLTRLCAYLGVTRALELGTSVGVGAHAMALHGVQVTTVEAAASVFKWTSQNLAAFENIKVVHGTFKAFLNGELADKPSGAYDLVFIDGHHCGEATIAYFEQLLPYAHKNTVFVLDDIYWSAAMTDAWKRLQKHEQVTVSIDCFYWGFLFLRTEQLPQLFHIKL